MIGFSRQLKLENSISEALFATLADPASANAIFKTISIKELAVTQFHVALCEDICHRPSEVVVPLFGKNENARL